MNFDLEQMIAPFLCLPRRRACPVVYIKTSSAASAKRIRRCLQTLPEPA